MAVWVRDVGGLVITGWAVWMWQAMSGQGRRSCVVWDGVAGMGDWTMWGAQCGGVGDKRQRRQQGAVLWGRVVSGEWFALLSFSFPLPPLLYFILLRRS